VNFNKDLDGVGKNEDQLPICRLKDYIISQVKTGCHDDSYEVIKTEDDCKKAGARLGGDWDGIREWSDRKFGCLWTIADTDVNFNKDLDGVGKNEDQLPICRLKERTTDLPTSPPTLGLRDGMRYRMCGDPIYLYYEGKCHQIPNLETMTNLFNDWSTENIRRGSCKIVNDIHPSARLVRFGNTHPVYLHNHNLRHIASRATFEACNFNWKKVVLLPAEDEKSFSKGPPIKF